MEVDGAEATVQRTCPVCMSVLGEDSAWRKVPATPTHAETWICSRCHRDAKRGATREDKINYADVGWQTADEHARRWQQWDAEISREIHFAMRLHADFQKCENQQFH